MESQKTRPKSDYDRSLTKSFEGVQKKTRVGKGVAQLRQQSQQSVPPLVIRNEYGSKLDLLDVDFEDLVRFYEILVWTLPKCSLKDHLLRKWIIGRNLNMESVYRTLRP